MARKKHLTLTPAQAKQLQGMGHMMQGAGLVPDNFDPDQWEDHSYIDFPVYVSKGRGQYKGQGGSMTSMMKLLYNKAANNPEVRKFAKRAAQGAVSKGSKLAKDFAKRRNLGALADTAIDLASGKASDAVEQKIKGGRRVRVNGHGVRGVVMSGSGTRIASSDDNYRGSGTSIAGEHSCRC